MSAEANILTDEQMLKNLQARLDKLLAEEKEALSRQAIRDKEIEKVQLAIEVYTPSIKGKAGEISTSSSQEEFVYPKGKPWPIRIAAYMKLYNKALTIAQLRDGMAIYEPTYTKPKLHAALSNVMSSLLKDGEVKSYKSEKKIKGYYYASPGWFDEKGVLQEQHKPIEKKTSLW